ncbi:uncharacterized protein DS421_20g681770 [Arachis hypogaea]|nr:uncharacterized protein DS421_20g681770 [Arachis hypogaea]
MGKRDITRADEHISEYLQHPIYGSRNLHTRHARVEEQLRESGFYHISQIGRIMSHVTGSTDHSTSGLENECMTQFGIAPGPNDHRGSGVKLAWFGTLKRRQHLTDAIHKFSWGSACLAHMYRSLCRASRYDCKDIDGRSKTFLVY